MIFVCKHPGAHWWRLAFGAAQVVDGTIRMLSLGLLATDIPMNVAKRQAKATFGKTPKPATHGRL